MNMLKLLRYALISAFVLVGIQNINAQENEMPQNSNENDLAYWYYDYSGYGTMSGAGQIYMEVCVTEGGMEGRYYYVKTNKNRANKAWIYVYGDWYGNTMNLCEEASGRKNGCFKGTFRGNSYKGTFYRNDGKKFSFNIKLK